MSDRGPATNDGGATTALVAVLITLAIVLLILFARGQEDQDRSGAPAFVAAITASA